MKKILFIVIGTMFCCSCFCKPAQKRKIDWNGKKWILNTKESKVERLSGMKNECGEGIYFLYEDNSNNRYLVDENNNKLSNKSFMHVGHFSNGKTIVSGYQEEQYETDRIYDIETDKVSDPLKNLWVYCAFVNGRGAFSYKNPAGELKAVLLDLNLKNVTGMEFDEFYELDFEKEVWHFKKGQEDYFIDGKGNIKKIFN